MAAIIAATLFALLMLAISFYGYRSYARPARLMERLGTPVSESSVVSNMPAEPTTAWVVRIIQQVGEKVPLSPEDASVTRRDLMMAGYKSDAALKVFFGIKVTACILLVIFSLLIRDSLPNPVLR